MGETAGVTQDVGSDPTVGDDLSYFCTLCGGEMEDRQLDLCEEMCDLHLDQQENEDTENECIEKQAGQSLGEMMSQMEDEENEDEGYGGEAEMAGYDMNGGGVEGLAQAHSFSRLSS